MRCRPSPPQSRLRRNRRDQRGEKVCRQLPKLHRRPRLPRISRPPGHRRRSSRPRHRRRPACCDDDSGGPAHRRDRPPLRPRFSNRHPGSLDPRRAARRSIRRRRLPRPSEIGLPSPKPSVPSSPVHASNPSLAPRRPPAAKSALLPPPQALAAFAPDAPAGLPPALADANLVWAARLVAAAQRSAAPPLIQLLSASSQPKHIRPAAPRALNPASR